jgi:hypothetical protein
MKQRHRIFTSYDHVCCFVLFFMAASASFNGFYSKFHFYDYGAQTIPPLGLAAMVDGTGFRPFVYRQMLPTAADWLDSATPASVKGWLYNFQLGNQRFPDAIFDSALARSQTYFFRYLIVYFATFLFALLAVYAMHWLCRRMDMNPVAAVLAPVVVMLLIPFIQCKGGFYYDFPEVAFMALAAWAAFEFEWWWLIPLAALGTWNKESFLFLIPTLYPIFRQRSSRLSSVIGTGVLCLVSAAVYYPIHTRFAHNAGGTALLGLPQQIRFFLHPGFWILGDPLFDKTYGLLLLPIYTILPMALLAWTALRGWRSLPPVIQRHGKIAAAINIPLYLLLGNPGELRNLSLLYITFLLLLLVNLTKWIDGLSKDHDPVIV